MATSKIADHADGGVDEETGARLAGIDEFCLQQIVGDIDRPAQIGEQVMDIAAHASRHRTSIEACRRQRRVAIEPLIEVEEEAIHRLQRIIRLLRFLVVVGCAACQTKAQQQCQQ